MDEDELEKFKRDLIFDVRRDHTKKDRVFAQLGELQGDQRRPVIETISKHVRNDKTIKKLQYCCSKDEIESIALPILVARRKWMAVGSLLGLVGDTKRRWAVEEASKLTPEVVFYAEILPHCYDDQVVTVLQQLMKRQMWQDAAMLLWREINGTLSWWASDDFKTHQTHYPRLFDILKTCHFHLADMRIISKKTDIYKIVDAFIEIKEMDSIKWDTHVPQLLLKCIFQIVLWVVTDSGKGKTISEHNQIVQKLLNQISQEILIYIQDKSLDDIFDRVPHKHFVKVLTQLTSQLIQHEDAIDYLDLLGFLENFTSCYHKGDRNVSRDEALVLVLATVPLPADLQEIALHIMLDQKRWDVIQRACLSHVSEQVRRSLFRAAVEQREWGVVKQWADHSLYDDQRGWALEEAFVDRQWDVMMLLADHGLTKTELMRVHYKVTKYADWPTCLALLERGADITEVRQLLEGAGGGRKRWNDYTPLPSRENRVRQLEKRESVLQTWKFKKAVAKHKWRAVLFYVTKPTAQKADVALALEEAVKAEAWQVVRALIKLKSSSKQRNSLFPHMVQGQQWGVCRVLLERGLSLDTCLEALPQLLAKNQWVLLARVMEYEVSQDVRRRVMEIAIERREGSLFWHCHLLLEEHIDAAKRESLFRQALAHDNWQAVRPLIVETDETGLAHRDYTTQEAINCCQWDVVDHCLRCHAEIDVLDAEGRTPLVKASHRRDWKTVEALLYKGADQNNVPPGENTPLMHATSDNTDACKLLVSFHADLLRENRYGRTVLGFLIDESHGDVIEHALLWSPDLHGGVGMFGATALHAACEAGEYDLLYYLVARGVDPLAVTTEGQTVLRYAVHNEHWTQRMLAECIKLGFSTHQPSITDAWFAKTGRKRWERDVSFTVSPMMFCVARDLPVLARMLYESGACSYAELFRLTSDVRKEILYENSTVPFLHHPLHFLERAASTPRSLMSTCRLFISHQLNVRGKRFHDEQFLRLLLSPSMARYVMFTDLTQPHYGKGMSWETELV